MTVIALKQLEIEPPILLAEALTDELFERLKMKKYPVLILKNIIGTAGFCRNSKFAENDEIAMAEEIFLIKKSESKNSQISSIRSTYLHESAHRIFFNIGKIGDHDAAFFCLNSLLHLRADHSLINYLSVYDFHEEPHFEKCFEWAWTLAKKLENDPITAENAGELILQEYKKWSEYMENKDEIAATRSAERQNFIKSLKNSAAVYKSERWQFSFYSFIFALGVAHFLKF